MTVVVVVAVTLSPREIVTLRGSARGSYLEILSQLFPILVYSSDSSPIFPKIHPKIGPNPLKTLPNPPKIDPKSTQKASWSPSWTNLLTKLDFERQKNAQEAPKSAQERPQTVPNPSQMEPKTFPKPIFKRFISLYFPIPHLHRCFVVFFF